MTKKEMIILVQADNNDDAVDQVDFFLRNEVEVTIDSFEIEKSGKIEDFIVPIELRCRNLVKEANEHFAAMVKLRSREELEVLNNPTSKSSHTLSADKALKYFECVNGMFCEFTEVYDITAEEAETIPQNFQDYYAVTVNVTF